MPLSQRRAALVRRLRSRRTREREASVLVEGVRAVTEALDARARIRFAVASPRLEVTAGGAVLRERLAAEGCVPDLVDDGALAEISDTEHPQGILVVCEQPGEAPGALSGAGRYLVLDAVQDPGNAGTLVRVAAAFGLDAVVALDGTVDLWGAKAVRGSAGMVFRIPVVTMTTGEIVAAASAAGVRLLVADPKGVDVARAGGGAGWALVLGNEGAGARDEVTRLASASVSVPMRGSAESLNVGMAGAILMYALTRETVLG